MKIYAAYYRRKYHRSRFSKVIPILFIVCSLVICIVIVHNNTTPKIISPVLQARETTASPETLKKPKTVPELQQRIERELNDSIPEYSILVEDFTRKLTVEIGDQIPFEGASLHKIPILLAIAKEIQQGALQWDNEIIFEEKDRQNYGTGSIRYQKAGGNYSIEKLCQLMMEESDNTAAYLLARRVLSFEKIQGYLTSWGINNTSMKDNTTTNADMKKMLTQLFTGTMLSGEITRKVISMLDDSIYEDRIPALLPKDVKVYHKIGTAIAGLHDVGIVVTPTSMYYIGILTKGVSDEAEATRTIARISKAVFDYMEE